MLHKNNFFSIPGRVLKINARLIDFRPFVFYFCSRCKDTRFSLQHFICGDYILLLYLDCCKGLEMCIENRFLFESVFKKKQILFSLFYLVNV